MKKIIMQLLLVGAVGGLAVSCANGPTGADPGQEIIVRYKQGALNQDFETRKTADFIVKYTNVILGTDGSITKRDTMSSSYTQSSLLTTNHIRFLAAAQPSPLDKAIVSIYWGQSNPTPGMTQTWTAADLSVGNPDLVVVNEGAVVYWNGNTYFPVEGETVFTSAASEGGRITLAAGHFNGKMKAVNGDEITIESCVFYHPKP